MKLVECYVENFGCLERFSYRFEQGLTTINEMNGWGKSTFAAFLRAMFYGLPQSTKRNLNENERIKYTPWNGKRMGGNLIFEVNGKQYKMERFFEKKEKDDHFALYDLLTNMESKDFTPNIGEELFGIDLDAYAKSAYISQNSIEIGTNDSINAKLGNLLDSDNDIKNFDKAIKKLKEAKKEYKKTGGRGRIGEIEKEIALKKIELEKTDVKKAALEERANQIRLIQENKSELQAKLKNVKQKIGEAATYQGYKEKKKQYDEVTKTLEEEIVATNEVLSFFKEELPKEDDLNKQKERISKLEQERGKQDSFAITSEEKENKNLFQARIAEGVFSEETLARMDERARRIREIDFKIAEVKLTLEELESKERLDSFFKEGIPTDQQLEKYNDQIAEIQHLDLEIARKETVELLEIKEVKKESKASTIIVMVVGILCLLTGIIFLFTPMDSFSMIMFGAGTILFGIAVIVREKKKRNFRDEVHKMEMEKQTREQERNKILNERRDILQELNLFFDQFEGLNQAESYIQRLMRVRDQKTQYLSLLEKTKKADTTNLEKDKLENQERLSQFFEKMNVLSDRENFEECLQEIRTNYNEFLMLRKKEVYEKENKEAISKLEKECDLFSNSFQLSQTKDYYLALEEVRKQVERLEYLHASVRRLEASKIVYEEMDDFEEWKGFEEKTLNLSVLQEEERALEEKRETILENEKEIQDRIDELLAETDELKEIEQEKELLEDELEKNQKKLEIIEGTITYLEEAKDLFSSHYLKGLRVAFERYMDQIGDENVSGAKIDAKMEVKVEKDGALRKIGYFSRGNQDLINVCARFALVDALFEEEKPFLVLDDTFVNFDGEKLEKVLQLIGEIADTYQIIYLVCHDSRVRDWND